MSHSSSKSFFMSIMTIKKKSSKAHKPLYKKSNKDIPNKDTKLGITLSEIRINILCLRETWQSSI